MARDLESITLDYWCVRSAVYHPSAPNMTTSDALRRLNSSDRLRPTDWRLSALMHDVRFDIIEGHSEWREKQRVAGSISILPTKG